MNINRLRKQSGQVMVETILLIVLVLGVATMVTKFFREEEVFAQLVSGPWGAVSGMIQNGVWESPTKSMNKHPNSLTRFSSIKGDVVNE